MCGEIMRKWNGPWDKESYMVADVEEEEVVGLFVEQGEENKILVANVFR